MTISETILELLNEPETPSRNKRMFDLHNQIFPKQKEKGFWCAGCRKRVRNKLINYANENK